MWSVMCEKICKLCKILPFYFYTSSRGFSILYRTMSRVYRPILAPGSAVQFIFLCLDIYYLLLPKDLRTFCLYMFVLNGLFYEFVSLNNVYLRLCIHFEYPREFDCSWPHNRENHESRPHEPLALLQQFSVLCQSSFMYPNYFSLQDMI